MTGWLLDTNIIAETTGSRPDRNVVRWLGAQAEEDLFLSVLTLGEYDKGIHFLPDGDARCPHFQAHVKALEARFAGRILPVSDAIVRRWGRMSGKCKRVTGHSPTVVDSLLAATAIEHNLYLATRNVRDVQHSGALIFNPWSDDPKHFPLSAAPYRRPGKS